MRNSTFRLDFRELSAGVRQQREWFGTRLGAAVQNLLYNKKKVDTDGIPAVTKGRI